jgi:hypothetical protein
MVKIIFDADEDWEKRTLCSDEACIGTIGPNGRCKECGKPYNGAAEAGSSVGSVVMLKEQKIVSESKESVSDDDWENRILCRDESCIGVIGVDGKCKECGEPGPK